MSEVSTSASVGGEISRRSTGRYAKYVFWIMFLISFLNYLDRYILSGGANVIARELGFGVDGIGYIASAFLIVYTLGTIPLGIWADRAKRKNVVAVSVTAWSLITAFTALATNFTTLFISRMFLGIGEAGYFPAGTALMSDYFSRSKRSRIMSWWNIGQLVGILAGFVIGGAVAGLYVGSWRLAFIFTGIPGLILAFLAWRLREPRRNEADEEDQELNARFDVGGEIEVAPQTFRNTSASDVEASSSSPSSPSSPSSSHAAIPRNIFSQFGSLLRIKTLVVLIFMQIFAFFVLGVNTVYLPTYLQQKDIFGLSSGLAGLFSGGVIVIAGIIGTITGGYMADALNRRHQGSRVLVCGIGFLLGAPTFALAVLSHNLIIFTIFFILTTIFLTIYQGPGTAATQDVVPSVLRASAVAVSLLVAHLAGDAFAPSLVGTLAKVFDPTHGQHFAQNMAGQDLSIALFYTCTPALVIAGLIGIFGARWMKGDISAAEEADRLVKAEEAA